MVKRSSRFKTDMDESIQGNEHFQRVFDQWCKGITVENIASRHGTNCIMIYEILTHMLLGILSEYGWKQHHALMNDLSQED